MFTNLKRALNFALIDFNRNKGVSLAAIFVLTVTTLLITGLFFVQGTGNYLILTIQNKIDVAAYFKQDTREEDILSIKDRLLNNSPEIKNVQYVSREDALEEFTKRHQENETFSKALLEVGDNPFLPSLNITTTGNPSSYEQISNILQSNEFSEIIEKVDFSQKKDTIEKVFSITSSINRFGLALSLLLILVATLVVFNTIKLVINGSKEEINNMRIVGAPSWFIRSPFVIEGAIFGLISFAVCFLLTLLLSYFLATGLKSIMPGFDLFAYFISNFWIVILIQLASGVGLGAICSFIAVKKYLSV